MTPDQSGGAGGTAGVRSCLRVLRIGRHGTGVLRPEGGSMAKSKWVGRIALVAILVTLGAACAKKSNTSTSNPASAKCNADQFGCVVYKPGQPIKLGTLLSISGNTAFLGTDS